MGSTTAQPLVGALNILGALLFVLQAAISVVATALGVISIVLSNLPVLLIGVGVTILMFPWVRYHDLAIENIEHGMRSVVFPAYWEDGLREFINIARHIYNPLICWWDAAAVWGYQMVRDVLYPVARDCGIKNLLIQMAYFVEFVALDVVVYLVDGTFWNQDADFTRITASGIAVFDAWQTLYTCSCSDLSNILRVVPIITPLLLVPPAWPLVLFSEEWGDPQTWCAIANFFNSVITLFRVALQLVQQVLYVIFTGAPPHGVFIRPDLRQVVNRLCPAIACLVRSSENIYQLLWDQYVPFTFDWHMYLSILDVAACIILKTIALFFRILVNIDQSVLYPVNPFWETVIKPDVIEIINLYVAPSQFASIPVPALPNPVRFTISDYYYDTSSQTTPLGAPNPVYNATRFSDALCIFINRTICDPADADTGCFSQGAQNLLMGINFCCLTNTVLVTLADFVSGLFEFSLHLTKGGDVFFLFADRQPFTTLLAADIVQLAHCLFSFFALIPVVGPSIRDILVDIIQYVLDMIDFLFRVLIGLLTLPYFLIVLPTVPNFLTQANEALNFFTAIHENLVADTPNSLKNALCVVLNNGFPIPPIPCSSCVVGGYVPPETSKRYLFDPHTGEALTSPVKLLYEVWHGGGVPPDSLISHLTPLLSYGRNHTTNPMRLYELATKNVKHFDARRADFPNLAAVNDFVDRKAVDLKERWRRIEECQALKREAAELSVTKPDLYERYRLRGRYACSEANQPWMPRIDIGNVVPMQPPLINSLPMGGCSSGSCGGSYTHDERQSSTTTPQIGVRPNLTATVPTVFGCTPPPMCFDLCCIVRSSLVLIVQILVMIARFFNGLIQGQASIQGSTQDFPYFTGEAAYQGMPTFETDIIALILDIFVPIKCLCNALNLIVPVVPTAFSQGRPDICCSITYISDLVAGIVTVVINSINSLALGAGPNCTPNAAQPGQDPMCDPASNFVYFRQGFFKSDVNTLFDIALAIVVCLCILLRAIFPLDYIPGFFDAVNFDPCCFGEVLLNTIIEIGRLLMQVIISLATITIDPTSFCYFRLDQTVDHACSGTIDGIGMIIQMDVVLRQFLPEHGEDKGACYANCGVDNGATGIVPCICQIFNTLIPWRKFPNKPTSCAPPPNDNCQVVDLCCPFSHIGFAIGDSLKFIYRGVVAFWQPWSNGLPEFFINYIWCDEGQLPPCPMNQTIPPDFCAQQVNKQVPSCPGVRPVVNASGDIVYLCGEFTCGKVNIVFADITDPFQGLLARCLCELFQLLDMLMALIFNLLADTGSFPTAGWSCCFCGGLDQSGRTCNANSAGPCTPSLYNSGSGVLPAISYVLQAILVALTNLFRKFPFSCYWRPAYPSVPSQISQTWIFEFLGPVADALAIASGNLVCFAESMFLLPQICLPRGEKFLGGVIRWVAEVIFRVVGFIEAFIEQFISVPNTCVGSACSTTTSSQSALGIDAQPLGNMLVILLSTPFDLLIGDGDVACSTICPSMFANPRPPPCGCWNLSPNYVNIGANAPNYQWVTTNATACIDPKTHAPVGEPYGNTSGCCVLVQPISGLHLPSPLPICQSPDDSESTNFTESGQPAFPGFPGSCAVLSACRPDSLPVIANDPMTSIGLAAAYAGGLDGIVMALLKYLRCLLDNLLGCKCSCPGLPITAICKECQCVQLGIIFYPAILIFSIMWQILGGFIRFVAACILFLFSLFTPPSGSNCGCWEQTVHDAWGFSGTNYYEQVGGLCYQCQVLRFKCETDWPVGTISGNDCTRHLNPCRGYCPLSWQQRFPLITEAEAMTMCINNITKDRDNPNLTPQAICSGHLNMSNPDDQLIINIPSYGSVWVNASANNPNNLPLTGNVYVYPPFNPLTITSNAGAHNNGLCQFDDTTNGPPPNSSYVKWDRRLTALLDMCPDPYCQFNAPKQSICGGMYQGFWPVGCGICCNTKNNLFDNSYPGSPLPTCGVLQIITNFLSVVNTFAQIFTTPLLISPLSRSLHGGQAPLMGGDRAQFVGPVNREPRQSWNRRYNGLLYGFDALNGPNVNFLEAVTEAFYNYDTSDCYSDPVSCHCRNLDLQELCTVDGQGNVIVSPVQQQRRRDAGRQADGPLTTGELFSYIDGNLFGGATVCDNIVGQVAASQNWPANVSVEMQNQYVRCIDQRIQGSRMQQVSDVIPSDILYNPRAPVTMIHNLFHTMRTSAERQFQRVGDERFDYRKEMERRFPQWGKQLRDRAEFARGILRTKGITERSIMFDAIVKFDRIWFKYQTGFYGFAMETMAHALANGRSFLPTTAEAMAQMRYAASDMYRVVMNQPYGRLVSATGQAVDVALRTGSEVLNEGPMIFLRRSWNEHLKRWPNRGGTVQDERRIIIKNGWYQSAVYRWWTGNMTDEARLRYEREGGAPITFRQHFAAVLAFQRERWQNVSFSFWTADLRFWSLKDMLFTRWQNPKWTPEKLQNLDRLKGFYYKVYDLIWPGHLAPELRDRFLFLSNCKVVDLAVNISTYSIDYCANEYVPNTNFTKREGAIGWLGSYVRDVSRFRENSYYNHRNRHRFVEVPSVEGDPEAWIRPRLLSELPHGHPALANASAASIGRAPPRTGRAVDFRTYRAQHHGRGAFPDPPRGPAGFNLYDWLLSVFEDLTGYSLGSQSDSWFASVRDWLTNPNTSITQWPNVGFAYWLRFPFFCNFPQNLNCSIGTGFETAFLWVTVATIAAAALGTLVLPIITVPFQILGWGLTYLIALSATAWHAPPACYVLLPSFPLPFGIALPMCAMDQIVAFLDKWITNCYVPLVIPAYMVAGNPCPTNSSAFIDFINCRDVGVSDGLQNLLLLGFWIFGNSFADFATNVVGNLLGPFIPGVQNYLSVTFNAFATANPTNMQRMTFCFYLTLPAMILPIGFLLLTGILVALVVPPALLLINAMFVLFFASPAAVFVPGADTSAWYGYTNDPGQQYSYSAEDYAPVNGQIDDDDDDDRKKKTREVGSATIRGWMRRLAFGSHDPKEKFD